MPTRLLVLVAAAAALSLVFASASPVAADSPPRMPRIQMVEAWPDAEFSQPIAVEHAGDGTDMLYVLEKAGRVMMLPKWRGVGPVPKAKVFVDMRAMVHAGGQGGVLGLAFHPRYKDNRRVFVSYLQTNSDPTNKFKLVIGELRASGSTASASTLTPLLTIPKKFALHNGGRIRFGPDGMLYIGTGDGGSKLDVDGESQSARSYLGKMLRIDVNGRAPGKAYGIPPDNPWPDIPTRVNPEIWAFGLRNPWGFDWKGERMWTTEPGTTGPASREWVTEVVRAGNHGWPFMEGNNRLSAPPPHIDARSLIAPTFEQVRGSGAAGTAGVGGRFYKGRRVPNLRGKYVFGDFMKGEAYCIDIEGPEGKSVGRNPRLLGEVPNLSSIGEDAQGELYFTSYEDGWVWTLAPE